jgi:hypothetical protein
LRAIQRAPGYTNERNAIEIAEAIAAPAFGGAIRTPSHQTTGKWNSRNEHLWNDRSWRILLQKSFSGEVQIF